MALWRAGGSARLSEELAAEPAASRATVALLTAIIESVPLALVVVDEAGAIVLANATAEELFGYRRDELLGRRVELLVPERFRSAHPDLRTGFLEHPTARLMGGGRDLTARRKDGSEFPVEIGLNPVTTEEGLFVVGAVVDLTERKRFEEALRGMNEELERRVAQRTAELARSNEALERSNLELKRFAYVASHDLKSPLRSISGFVQLLEEDYGERLDAQGRSWIRRVVESTARLQTLINDLLDYARVDAAGRPFEPTDLNRVFEELVGALRETIRARRAEVSRGELPTVLGDRSQLAQLLQNLIENGIVYGGVDGPPRVHVSAREEGDEWVISVEDNGIGIEPEQQERIFDIFHRLHTHGAYPGTGIGLAVCRRVVLRHGGRIWVDSEPGAGSVFRCTIPRGKERDR